MAFKIVVALAFIGVASASVAQLVLIRQTIQQPALLRIIQPQNPLPQYTYTYGVRDIITGDSKTASETRNGNVVNGEYSLNDADGFKRTVTYTADAVHGFQALVERKPITNAIADVKAYVVEKPVPPHNKDNRSPTRQGLIHSAPYTYGAPQINSAPITHSSPALYTSRPATVTYPHVERSVFKPTLNLAYLPPQQPSVYIPPQPSAYLPPQPSAYLPPQPSAYLPPHPSAPFSDVESSPQIVVNSLPIA